MFAVYILTDVLDGYAARKLNQVSDFGEYFDFAADFIGYYALIILFAVTGLMSMLNIILIGAATVVLLWIAITLSRKAGRMYMPHRTSSKVMAVLLTVSFIAFILGLAYADHLLLVSLALIFVYTVPDYARYCLKYKGR